jgi:hypothetical protein
MPLGGTTQIQFEMMRWHAYRCIALFVGLLIALTPAVNAPFATPIALQKGTPECVAYGDCDCCPKAKGEHAICSPTCAYTPLFAATANHGDSVVFTLDGQRWPFGELRLRGHSLSPDPPPPKPGLYQ